MQRHPLASLLSGIGTLLTLTFLFAGGLLAWGANSSNTAVHSQLSHEKIYFPPKAAFDHPAVGTPITPSMIPSVSQYAGEQLVTGEQAKVYADDFLAVQLSEVAGGLTYAQISTKAMADPSNAVLAYQSEVIFRGTAVRGMLLNVYAIAMFSKIAQLSAIASFILAGLMLLLTALVFSHHRRTGNSGELVQPDSN
jgi:hypothetical protein